MRKMRLYLASLGFGGDPSFLRRPAKDGRALVVVNAMDEYGDEGRLRGFDDTVAQLRGLGYAAEELDLRTYFGARLDDTRLQEAVADAHLVWVTGGNTFVLARAMRAARFSRAIARPLRDGTLTYGGFSAGACVAGPDLAGIDLMDDANIVPEGYDADVEPEGLGLVPFRIVPHWGSQETFGDAEPLGTSAQAASTWLTRRKLEHRTLRDDEVITFG